MGNLDPLDNPDVSIEDLKEALRYLGMRDAIGFIDKPENEYIFSLSANMSVMPRLRLKRHPTNNPGQRWDCLAHHDDFFGGFTYASTPAEALKLWCQQWYKDVRLFAEDRIHRMDVQVSRINDILGYHWTDNPWNRPQAFLPYKSYDWDEDDGESP